MEFFEDFLIRNMMAAPAEYMLWPPALKLFYRFLHEKRYLNNPDKIIGRIDKNRALFYRGIKASIFLNIFNDLRTFSRVEKINDQRIEKL